MGICAQPPKFQGTQRKRTLRKREMTLSKYPSGRMRREVHYTIVFFPVDYGQTKTAGSRPRVAIWPCLARTANYQEPVKPGTAKFTNMIG